MDHLLLRGPPFGRIDDGAVAPHDRLGGSHDTDVKPWAPPATSASVTSSIDTCGGNVVW